MYNVHFQGLLNQCYKNNEILIFINKLVWEKGSSINNKII